MNVVVGIYAGFPLRSADLISIAVLMRFRTSYISEHWFNTYNFISIHIAFEI